MMRRNIKICLALLAGFLCAASAGVAAEFRSGKDIRLDGDFKDVIFISGEKVGIGAKVADDIFAAGGKLNFTGASADHVITAGGEIAFHQAQVKDIIAFGGHIDLVGTKVSDDVVMSSGELRIDRDSVIGSSAIIAGGEITLDGEITGDLTVRGGEVTLNGKVDGDADIAAHVIRLGPNAVIGGNFRYRAESFVTEAGATIKGKTTILPSDEKKWKDRAASVLLAASIIGLLFLAGLGVAVLVLAGVFAGHMQATDRAIRGRTFSTLGIGFLAIVGIPVLFTVFAATIIGLPLAILLIALLVAIVPLALAATAHATGMAIRSGFTGGKGEGQPRAGGRILYALLGLAVIVVLGIVPFIGSLVWVVACVLGVGASYRTLFASLARPEGA